MHFLLRNIVMKGIVHPKCNLLTLKFVPNAYEFLSSAEPKRRYSQENMGNQTIDGPHWLPLYRRKKKVSGNQHTNSSKISFVCEYLTFMLLYIYFCIRSWKKNYSVLESKEEYLVWSYVLKKTPEPNNKGLLYWILSMDLTGLTITHGSTVSFGSFISLLGNNTIYLLEIRGWDLAWTGLNDRGNPTDVCVW